MWDLIDFLFELMLVSLLAIVAGFMISYAILLIGHAISIVTGKDNWASRYLDKK